MKLDRTKIWAYDVYVQDKNDPTIYDCIGLQMAKPPEYELDCLCNEEVTELPRPKFYRGFDDDEVIPTNERYDDYVYIRPNKWIRRNWGNHEEQFGKYREVPTDNMIFGIHKMAVL